jgi:hypothetical protein
LADPILPSASAIATSAINGIVSARPSTLQHFNNPASIYNDLPAMWRAQALLLLARDADEVRSARLKFSTGDALRSLAASEFRVQLPPQPQTASALVQFYRPNASAGQGIVRTGTQFKKLASPTATPLPIQAATYQTIAPVFVSATQTVMTLQLVATQSGTAANLPYFVGQSNAGLIVPGAQLFDTTFTQSTSAANLSVASASGGSSGLPDPVVVAACKAYAVGQFGPTQGAAIAGLLQQQSVRHYAVFPASDALPFAAIYVADESWADSSAWHNTVAQNIANNWTGFGCRARFGQILNLQIAVNATFELQSTDDLNDTTSIDVNVRSTAESYFNDRPDWYRFRNGALQQFLSKADPRIRHCTSVTITNTVTGNVVPEPANNFVTQYQPYLYHYYLTDSNVSTSYLPPT